MEFADLSERLSYMGAAASGYGQQWLHNRDIAQLEMQKYQDEQRKQHLTQQAQLGRLGLQHMSDGRYDAVFETLNKSLALAQQFGDQNGINVATERLNWLSGMEIGKLRDDFEMDDREAVAFEMLPPIGGAGESPAGIQELEYARDVFKNPDNYNPDFVNAVRVKYGLSPRAGSSMYERLADDPSKADRVAEVEGQIAGSKQSGKDVETRRSGRINVGYDAAKGLAVARRGLELLRNVQTGGVDAIDIKTRQKLGLESADQGELANLLGKAVLSQLRETFGAQFTEKEGRLLMDIEAGISKNNKTNMRLLNQIVQRSERYAQTAIDDALAVKDYRTAAEIQDLIEFRLSDESWLDGDAQMVAGGGQQKAPQEALDYLKANPGAIDDFVAKYGYRPEGF